jgi:chromosome segregation ATPase
MEMNVITSVQPASSSSSEQVTNVDQASQLAMTGARPAIQTELSGIIGRLMAEALAEANVAVERARAASQSALEASKAALEEQTRRNVALSASLLESETEVEELRAKLQAERDKTKAAMDAHDSARRAHAEMLNEYGIREQLVAAYELRLRDVDAQLDAMRAAFTSEKQQREREAADQAKLIAALKTVQQACAVVESETNRRADWKPEERPDTTLRTQSQPSPRSHDDDVAAHSDAAVAAQIPDDETSVPTAPAARRSLMLVSPTEPPAVAVPSELLEYLRSLFEQIEATYVVDVQAHAMADVLDLLCANVRCARNAFVQRASVDGVNGAEVFEQQLSAKLDEFGATPLGRHLSIAAYELTHARVADVRAEAS